MKKPLSNHYFFVVIILFLASCGKVKDGPPIDIYPVCMDPIGTDLPRACCQNTDPNQTTGNTCPVKDPGKALIKDTIFAATCSLESAIKNIELANQLLGSNEPGTDLCSGPGTGTGNSSSSSTSTSSSSSGASTNNAAQAASIPETQYGQSSAIIPNTPLNGGASEINLPDSQAVVANPSGNSEGLKEKLGLTDALRNLGFPGFGNFKGKKNSAADSGGPGGSAGGLPLSGAQNSPEKNGATSSTEDQPGSNSVYSAGGGAGNGGSQKNSSPFSFGMGDQLSANGGKVNYRGLASGVSPFVNPEDAGKFAVLSPEDNIFQKVHSRYQSEQATWHLKK